MLVRHPHGSQIFLAWRNGESPRSSRLREWIDKAAADFRVSFSVMRRSLEERGILIPYGQAKKLALAPRNG